MSYMYFTIGKYDFCLVEAFSKSGRTSEPIFLRRKHKDDIEEWAEKCSGFDTPYNFHHPISDFENKICGQCWDLFSPVAIYHHWKYQHSSVYVHRYLDTIFFRTDIVYSDTETNDYQTWNFYSSDHVVWDILKPGQEFIHYYPNKDAVKLINMDGHFEMYFLKDNRWKRIDSISLIDNALNCTINTISYTFKNLSDYWKKRYFNFILDIMEIKIAKEIDHDLYLEKLKDFGKFPHTSRKYVHDYILELKVQELLSN